MFFLVLIFSKYALFLIEKNQINLFVAVNPLWFFSEFLLSCFFVYFSLGMVNFRSMTRQRFQVLSSFNSLRKMPLIHSSMVSHSNRYNGPGFFFLATLQGSSDSQQFGLDKIKRVSCTHNPKAHSKAI